MTKTVSFHTEFIEQEGFVHKYRKLEEEYRTERKQQRELQKIVDNKKCILKMLNQLQL